MLKFINKLTNFIIFFLLWYSLWNIFDYFIQYIQNKKLYLLLNIIILAISIILLMYINEEND